MNQDDFKDRYGPVALVTGASSGIGKAFAEILAAKGLDLVLVARRLDRLEELAAQLKAQHGVQVTTRQIDLARPDAAQQMLDATASLDVGLVVSNAGFGLKGEHAANDPQAMTEMLMVNCNVPMQLVHGFTPRLRKRGKGGIIFTSSIEALMGCPYSAAYSSSKALVNALGEALWAELSPEGIDVLTLCPGATESEAAGNQGIDISKLQNVMTAEAVARLTLDNIRNGPTFFSSEPYKAQMDKLLSLPRQTALMAMAQGMKQ
ncbi:SDR family NAD(P)-dependent oxidoreductase [Phenylobacterium sp. LjRoot225]|uniref:SDR family NAD(P)-dependent oxidoreductase n=1 Tax=Phenylobacterium sp. LjRoot225 TaxID=3342285 RepID=UPI003ED145D4